MTSFFSVYRLQTADARYGDALWDWPSPSKLTSDGGVEVCWPAHKKHPFEMTTTYHWMASNVMDVRVTGKVITDGRWERPPNRVAGPEECFAVSMPFDEDPHRSIYLSLFGRDLEVGETATARTRLVIDRDISECVSIVAPRTERWSFCSCRRGGTPGSR